MKRKDIGELNTLYADAQSADQKLKAEQRSNVLLIHGDHYQNRSAKFLKGLRDQRDVSSEQKLRLTKNHVQRIVKTYVANIIGIAPGVTIMPTNDKELSDQKASELAKAVWEDGQRKTKFKKMKRQLVEDYVGIGEAAVKIFWNPFAGEHKGYYAEVDEAGQVVMDPLTGQPKSSKNPAYSGQLEIERMYGFNMFRHRDAKSMETSPFIGFDKMVNPDDMAAQLAHDPEHEKKIEWVKAASREQFVIFDAASGGYSQSSKEIQIREFYFRPSPDCPNGYFYICTSAGILFEGELPFGIFPIHTVGFDEVPTSPRSYSLVKLLRPYQAEINRTASKIAEHQVTLGDDKLLVQNGTKISSAGQVPGVRAISYQGMAPTYLEGRSGAQYLEYMVSQIKEMYEVAMVAEDSTPAQIEANSLLFAAASKKKRFSTYAEKFEDFLSEICFTYLELARNYYTEEMLIPAISRREAINIAEFKNSEKLCYKIKVEPQAEDIESKMGKFMLGQQILQFSTQKLDKQDIGKIIRSMPYGNMEETFSDLTMDYDNATSVVLALDRGEDPVINLYDPHEYMIKRLTSRMRQGDFNTMDPKIQQNYRVRVKTHEGAIIHQQQVIQAAQAGFIPSGGPLVIIDFYVKDPLNPMKTRRARIPYESVQWLIKKLEQQGSSLDQLEGLQQGVLAEIAQGNLQNRGQAGQGQGVPTAIQGQNSPQGVGNERNQQYGGPRGSGIGIGHGDAGLVQPTVGGEQPGSGFTL